MYGKDDTYSIIKTKSASVFVWWADMKVPVVPGKTVCLVGRLATVNNGQYFKVIDAVPIKRIPNLDILNSLEYKEES